MSVCYPVGSEANLQVMSVDKGEHSKDADAGKTDDSAVADAGTTHSKQHTENIIEGLLKRLSGSLSYPKDPPKTGN